MTQQDLRESMVRYDIPETRKDFYENHSING